MTATNKACRYLVMAGGTGGHIFPAIAVAKELQKRGASVSWLGTSGMESTIVPNHHIDFYALPVKGFRGKNILQQLLAPLYLLSSVFQAMKVIRKTQSDIVVGFGGFVAAPGGIAARLMGKPLIIHEQNSVAGSTNKLLNKLAAKTLSAFPGALPNAVHVGNPVRSDIVNLHQSVASGCLTAQASNNTFHLLITGGSLGAKAINDVMPHAIAELLSTIKEKNLPLNIEVLHQTGQGKQSTVTEAYAQLGIKATTEEFIGDVAAAYQWADVVICRAGALTVSEIAVASVPAIFIPLPSAIDNHQYHNAKWLVDSEASLLIEQQSLTSTELAKCLTQLAADHQKLSIMKTKLHALALPQAAERVTDYCEALCASSTKGTSHAV
ncbi:undecaprenyldiphospho-muramoylpentapeptide beta-N-acetylglucosaminyltransferase [Eionea flava]